MNVVSVRINGVDYNLRGQEKEEYLHMVASYVDKKLKNIMDGNSTLSTAQAAMLTAINSVDEMFKSKNMCEELEEKFKSFQMIENSLNEQVENLQERLKHMEEYNFELQLKVKNSDNSGYVKEIEEKLDKTSMEMEAFHAEARNYKDKYESLNSQYKEVKFQLQSAKYKLMDLEKKLVDNQINLVKEKRNNHPLLNENAINK